MSKTMLWILVFIGSFPFSLQSFRLTTDVDGIQSPLDSTVRSKFSWATLHSSEELSWAPCGGRFECAKLTVPLNHSDPYGPRKAHIALNRLPALVSRTSSSYRGPVLVNPGGPGASGVDFVEQNGQLLQDTLGPAFDILGFDPRGVSRSTPNAVFYTSDAERVQWEWPLIFPINSTQDRMARFLAHTEITVKLAKDRDQGQDVLGHINTENTARDMLKIVEAHGRDKLQYIGYSYGTVLGAVFATLYPDKVERLLLDGVAAMDSHFHGKAEKDLTDTDKTWSHFTSGCHHAGPTRCALYESTPSRVSTRINSILDSIRSRPLPVRTKRHYGIVDYDLVRRMLWRSLYTPYRYYQPLAEALAQLEGGDGSAILDLFLGPKSTIFECPTCSNPNPQSEPSRNTEVGMVIQCNDSQDILFGTMQEMEEMLERLLGVSEWGDMWASVGMMCSTWRSKFPKPFGGPIRANISVPILLIGNTADPVTPLRGAYELAEAFPNTAILTQNSPGHMSLSAFSRCTHKYIGEYFRSGALPSANTTCEVDVKLFPGKNGTEPQDDHERLASGVLGAQWQTVYKPPLGIL